MKSVALVLLFADEKKALELGHILWSGLKEVAAFYGQLPDPPTFDLYYLGTSMPASLRGEAESTRSLIRKFFKDQEWDRARGRYQRTFDAFRIGQQVRESLSVNPDILLVVFDQEITPPEGWRYVIWRDSDRGSVVSVAPTDPRYWSIADDATRLALIKHRVRTATLSAIGELLGIRRCDNPQCVMYAAVDSVTVLDRMVLFGPEHGINELVGRGYDPSPAEPIELQSILDEPTPPPIQFLA